MNSKIIIIIKVMNTVWMPCKGINPNIVNPLATLVVDDCNLSNMIISTSLYKGFWGFGDLPLLMLRL